MKNKFIIFFCILTFASCTRNKLNQKIFKSGDITVSWYQISEITTTHDFVDIARWGHTKNIMKSNTSGIYDILLDSNTVTIQIKSELVVYELSAYALNCHIELDSSVSTYKYLKRYNPAGAEAFKNESDSAK